MNYDEASKKVLQEADRRKGLLLRSVAFKTYADNAVVVYRDDIATYVRNDTDLSGGAQSVVVLKGEDEQGLHRAIMASDTVTEIQNMIGGIATPKLKEWWRKSVAEIADHELESLSVAVEDIYKAKIAIVEEHRKDELNEPERRILGCQTKINAINKRHQDRNWFYKACAIVFGTKSSENKQTLALEREIAGYKETVGFVNEFANKSIQDEESTKGALLAQFNRRAAYAKQEAWLSEQVDAISSAAKNLYGEAPSPPDTTSYMEPSIDRRLGDSINEWKRIARIEYEQTRDKTQYQTPHNPSAPEFNFV